MRALTSFLSLALLPIAVLAASCGDDGSGVVQPDAQLAVCSDGLDNDADGKIDFPEDPGCVNAAGTTEEDSALPPECSDGRDNDGDGKTDFPDDPGCINDQASPETDDCPDGPNCPQCANGRDDDANGDIDFPADRGCDAASDTTEFVDNPDACGATIDVSPLPMDGIVEGELTIDSTTSLTNECTTNVGAPALAYSFQLTEPRVVVASTDDERTIFDSVLSIRGADCTGTDALACNDNISTSNESSRLEASLPAGTYYLIVQGWDAGDSGTFRLVVNRFGGEGVACTMQSDCGPGLTCRTPAGGSTMSCEPPICGDGRDDDGDGDIDFPADPGCTSATDNDEVDDCPSGPNCPECADGVDNDGDTHTDYPADTTCMAASNDSESCTASEGVTTLVMPSTPGTLAMATDDVPHAPACSTSGSAGRDLTYRVDLPGLSTITFTNSSTSVYMSLLDSTCAGTPVQCTTSTTLTRTAVTAGTYYLVVDGKTTSATSTFTLGVTGKIANGQSCESPLAASGALTCSDGYACKGTAGARTCQVAQCNDGIDNNGGGLVDYPADPGCTNANDDTETTVCPGPLCPQCSDGIDNDGDTRTDYPADTSCRAASGTNEFCNSTEEILVVTTATTTGETTTATNDVTLPTSCQSSTSTGKDRTYQLDLPATTTFTVELDPSWDATGAILNSTCGGTPLTCQDANTVTITNSPAGTYFYVVDGWGSGSGTFTFEVSGKVADGGSCESPLFAAGALTCANPNYTCAGTPGARTCSPPQCSDGIDNNGTGGTDYPNDPGCSTPGDAMEDTVACPGAACPVCANTTDEDADTLIDYPADFGCGGRGSTTEVFCLAEPDYAGVITMPLSQGTLAGAADNYDQTCQAMTGNDRVYSLQLPVPVASLRIDTIGSAVSDTVISLQDAGCGYVVGCDDDGDPAGNLSLLTLTNVAAGNYAIQVDGYQMGNNGGYSLNVKGTVAPMTACSSPLFASGVLVCPTGTTCTGAGAAAKCQ